nr:protein yellow-like [Halyomorpha halys]
MLIGSIPFQTKLVDTKLNLVEEFSWKQIDYDFGGVLNRKEAIDNEVYIPGASIPTGIEVWGDKMFIAIPRIKSGVPFTLNYISLSDINTKSPILLPYPSQVMNNFQNKSSKKAKMTSIFSIRADPCNRLWALDTGISEEATVRKVETPPTIFIFNLNDNSLLRKYVLQENEFETTSKFRNILIDVTSGTCENAFAYLADTKHGLVVYSWLANKSYRIKNNYFSFDPIWGNFQTNSGFNVQLNDGLFGMTLTIPNHKGQRYLLFQPMIGTKEFRVKTQILQNKTLAHTNVTDFYLYGDRGDDSQSAASYMDLENGVLFYTTLIKNGVNCWNYNRGERLQPENQGTITEFPHKKAFPYDMKIDKNGTIWVLCNRLLDFLYDNVPEEGIPFHIYSGRVRNIIKGTPCEEI